MTRPHLRWLWKVWQMGHLPSRKASRAPFGHHDKPQVVAVEGLSLRFLPLLWLRVEAVGLLLLLEEMSCGEGRLVLVVVVVVQSRSEVVEFLCVKTFKT